MIYALKIYRFDRRCKTGLRLVGTYDFNSPDDEAMKREVNALRGCGYWDSQYQIEFAPKFKTVNNLMSGKAIQIAADTPLCCDPSSETYWSM